MPVSGAGGGASGTSLPPTELQTDESYTVQDRQQMVTEVPIVLASGASIVLGVNSAHVTLVQR